MTRTRTHAHIAVVLVLFGVIISTAEGSWLQRFFASSMASASEPASESGSFGSTPSRHGVESSGSTPSHRGVERSQNAYSNDPNEQFEFLENTVAESAEPVTVSTVGGASNFRHEPNHNSNLKTVVGDLVAVSESILEKASRPSGLHWTVESKSATFIVLSIVGDAHVVSAGHQMLLALDDSVRLVETSIQGHVDVSATLSTPKPGHYDITAMLIDPHLRRVLASTGTGTLIVEGYSTKPPSSAKSSSTHNRGSESDTSSDHGADQLEENNMHHDGDSAGAKESSKQSAGNQQQQTSTVKSESVKITDDIIDPADMNVNSKGQILPSDDQRKVVRFSRRENDLNAVTPDTESVLMTPFNHENHDSIQRCLEVSGKKLAALQLQAVTAPRPMCHGSPDFKLARDLGTETCDDISGLCMTLFDQTACTTSIKELLHWVNITYAVPVTLSLEPRDSVMIISFTSWRQRLVIRHNIEDIIEDGGGQLTMEAQNGDNIGLCIATSDGRVRYNVATTL